MVVDNADWYTADLAIARQEMRIRFAAAALQGLLADPHTPGDVDKVARSACNFADALIREFERRDAV